MKVKEIKYGDPWPENLHWSGDPVRPELSREFRQSAGREVYTNDGAIIQNQLKVGQIVMVPKFGAKVVVVEGETYIIASENDVLGIIKKK